MFRFFHSSAGVKNLGSQDVLLVAIKQLKRDALIGLELGLKAGSR